MYYILQGKPYGDMSPTAVIGHYIDRPDADWYEGVKFRKALPQPIRCVLDPEVDGPLPLFFDDTVPIFEESLLQTLLDAGVDNLDVYDAVILDDQNGDEYHEYKAVNVVGVVRAADMTKSKYSSYQPTPLIAVDFDGLVIDETKTNGLLMFRLAECVSAIVVHESVANLIKERDLYVGLTDPKDFIS